MLTALETPFGPCYVALDDLSYIGASNKHVKYGETREIGLRHTGKGIYILDSKPNHAKLKHLLPEDAPALAQAPKPARQKKGKA